MKSKFTIILYYKYTEIADPKAFREQQFSLAQSLNLKGRIIVAREGLNGTLEGTPENIEAYCEDLKKQPGFSDVEFKISEGTGKAFPKLSVKVRSEIVSGYFGKNDTNPAVFTGKYLKPAELEQMYQNGEDFVVVDMRNDYEHKVGHFKNSILPPLTHFRDLPKVVKKLFHLKDKKVVTVCTGGVRCEKASGFLMKKGFKNVYQLEGGIVRYLEQYPNSAFKGKLYVFDDRIALGFGDPQKSEVIGRCDLCDVSSEEYVNCADDFCHKHFICCTSCRNSYKTVFCGGDKCLNPENFSFLAKLKSFFKKVPLKI